MGENTNRYITKARENGNPKLADLFLQIQKKLVQYNNSLVGDVSGEKLRPIQHTWNNPNLPQEDTIQTDKITDRIEKVKVFDDTHMPMKRDQLGVVNSYQLPVVQDTLNPNLKNSYNRFIVLDSQYRQGGSGTSSSDYMADLSDILFKVLSIRLYSIQIQRRQNMCDAIQLRMIHKLLSFHLTATFWIYYGNSVYYYTLWIYNGNSVYYILSGYIMEILYILYSLDI